MASCFSSGVVVLSLRFVGFSLICVWHLGSSPLPPGFLLPCPPLLLLGAHGDFLLVFALRTPRSGVRGQHPRPDAQRVSLTQRWRQLLPLSSQLGRPQLSRSRFPCVRTTIPAVRGDYRVGTHTKTLVVFSVLLGHISPLGTSAERLCFHVPHTFRALRFFVCFHGAPSCVEVTRAP